MLRSVLSSPALGVGSALAFSLLGASAANAAETVAPATTVGGYGEIGYNAYLNDATRNQADLKRFVLFLQHRFNDKWSVSSEIEWEHAVASAEDHGETEIEQAYLNYQIAGSLSAKFGLFLMPFGLLNESHEPPVFYGVERNEVETRIIPSTWREGGIGLTGNTSAGLVWEAGVTTGFDLAHFDDAGAPLAGSHQELQLARARNLAAYGALNYRGVPGLTAGAAIFGQNGLQGNADHKRDSTQPDFAGIRGRLFLWDAHARWQKNGLDLQALYTRGRITDASRIDAVLNNYNTLNPDDQRALVPEEFHGWLVQGAYTVWERGESSLTPFARYEQYDAQGKTPADNPFDRANADEVFTAGLSFKPLAQIVFKADYQKFMENSGDDRINLGLGYMF